MPIEIGRRALIGSLISLVAAPAVVRASALMPVKSFTNHNNHYTIYGFDQFNRPIKELVDIGNGVCDFRHATSVSHYSAITAYHKGNIIPSYVDEKLREVMNSWGYNQKKRDYIPIFDRCVYL